MQRPPERLGSFYLGAVYDLDKDTVTNVPVTYDARDLTTHAVVVGMTGSGKTGLCIDLLEEAALDQVPAILVDPKGDVTNLLLQFPDLRPEDFRPWINPDDARRKGMSDDEYAEYIANLWRKGLAEWDIDGERIRGLQQAADYTIYTPGSDAGVPVNILGSLAAPGLDFDEHAEAIRERIAGTVAALLSLVGVKGDPVRSREAILLANIFEHYWRQGEDLDLTKLIMAIQNPPVRQLGVFDVDTFFPPKDRFELAMAFNNLVASPNFRAWLEGDPLDVDALLYTGEGKPRHSIFYIAHLSDAERMFFVTLLLENIVTWVRRQSGTTSLRALLYFDEVFGYFPPVAEPPSKRPLLTLLKQARAFGLGVVLVTQNPVDIDYKGLTNAGTWFIGKLQAERDKDRVLQGLKGAIAEAGGSAEAIDYETLITRLDSRVFLMHNVHEDRPVVFYTRWAMSYLRGPLTRPQIRRLMKQRQAAAPVARPEAPAPVAARQEVREVEPPAGLLPQPPALNPDIPQVFIPVALDREDALARLADRSGRDVRVRRAFLVYEPAVVAATTVEFLSRKWDVDHVVSRLILADPPERAGKVNWEDAEALPLDVDDLEDRPARVGEEGPYFAPAPETANSVRELKRIGRDLKDWLYHTARVTIKVHPTLDIVKRSGDREKDFRLRIRQAARERRDKEIDELRARYEKRLNKLAAKLNRLQRELAEDEAEYEARKREALLTTGETVLSFFLGRRRRITTIATKQRLAAKARMDIEETKQEIAEVEKDIEELRAELEEAVADIRRRWEDALDDIEEVDLKPRRADVNLSLVAVAWRPVWYITYEDVGGERVVTIPAYAAGTNAV